MLFAILKKVLISFTTNIENVNSVIIQEVRDITMKTKIKYQCNKKYIMKKIEINFYRNKMIIAKKRSKEYKELQRSFVELQNKLKALEEKIKVNESEKH